MSAQSIRLSDCFECWPEHGKKVHTDAKTYREWDFYKAILDHNIHATAAQRLDAFLLAKGLAL